MEKIFELEHGRYVGIISLCEIWPGSIFETTVSGSRKWSLVSGLECCYLEALIVFLTVSINVENIRVLFPIKILDVETPMRSQVRSFCTSYSLGYVKLFCLKLVPNEIQWL